MTENKLKALVAEAVALDQQIAALQEELRGFKQQLIFEAESRKDDASRTDGGGYSVALDGADGCVARVTFPGPSLKVDIGNEGKAFEKIKLAAAPYFVELFVPFVCFAPIEGFRERAATLLGKSAKRLIDLCEKDSRTTVHFVTKAAAP